MSVRDSINSFLLQRKVLKSQAKLEGLSLAESEDLLVCAEEAQRIIQDVAQSVQQIAHNRIASVVTKCLGAIFEEPYEFRIDFDQKRGRTEATLVFIRGGLELTDPMNEVGGGVIDVAAFALRLACLVLERPQKRRLLVLDEPFSKIRGEHNRKRMRELVESLATEFGVQFIVCIDGDAYPEFVIGNVVEL